MVGMGLTATGTVSVAGVMIVAVAEVASVAETAAGVGDAFPSEGAKGFRQPASSSPIIIITYPRRRCLKGRPPILTFAQGRLNE